MLSRGVYQNNSLYTYENGTLINKYGIENEEVLEDFELQIVGFNLLTICNLNLSKFDKKAYFELHKSLFEEIYEFAGKIRQTNIAKDNTLFCQYHLINSALNKLFRKFKKEVISSKEDIIKVIAYYYSEINMIHAFREGNGRTNRMFFQLYAKYHGYDLNFKKVDENELLEATIYSSVIDNSKLIKVLKKCVK